MVATLSSVVIMMEGLRSAHTQRAMNRRGNIINYGFVAAVNSDMFGVHCAQKHGVVEYES